MRASSVLHMVIRLITSDKCFGGGMRTKFELYTLCMYYVYATMNV